MSADPDIFSRICSIISPPQALAALEATLTDRQLQGYNFIYTEGGQLDNATYKCWSELKDLCKQAVMDLPVLNSSKPDENSLLLSCSLSDVVSDVSGLMKSADVQPSTLTAIQAADMQVESEHSFAEAVDNAKDTCSTPISHNFPFRNTSFPGDGDNDILPYPKSGARRGRKQSDKQHFFLLTSKEAIEYKQKEKEEKLAKEKEKQDKISKRLKKKAEKEKSVKENKQQGNKRNTKKQRSEKIAMNSPMKANSVNKKRKATRSRDSKDPELCSCFVCGEEYVDPPTEEWIQCDSCAIWVHEECANIEGSIFVCENCD